MMRNHRKLQVDAAAPLPKRHDVAASGVPARLATLQAASLPELREEWRRLFCTEPPGYSQKFLTARLAYRVQELLHGGLRPETLSRLNAIAETIDGKKKPLRQAGGRDRPIPGTRLLREWQGVEHTVTVLRDGYEWRGQPYRSLSAIARAIAGTQWNGPRFFGLRGQGAT